MGTIRKTTRDYSKFKKINGNRVVEEKRVIELMTSFEESYLTPTIDVNEKFEVIDGQHRLEAAKRLGLPIGYEIHVGWGLEECQVLNRLRKNWGKDDFRDSFAGIGNVAYLQLIEFQELYPDFKVGTAESIVSNCQVGKTKDFKEGKFEVADFQLVIDNAEKILEYKPYFKYYNNTWFVRTLISLFKNPNFDNDLMIKKLQIQPRALVRCATITQYKLLMQDIYNYRSRNKINLIYNN